MKITGSIALLALLLPVTALAAPPPMPTQNEAKKAPAPGGPRPVIEFPSMAFNFGELYHQEQYVHAFTVKNTGKADLTIEDVKPG